MTEQWICRGLSHADEHDDVPVAAGECCDICGREDPGTQRDPAQPAPAEMFPAETFTDARTHLRRPFTPEAVRWKVQAQWPNSPNERPKAGLIVGYIDQRLVVDRLNLVVADHWHDDYAPDPTGAGLMCRLTVFDVTRPDIGQGTGKGLYSDALKRAAVKFGVGVSIYALPKIKLTVEDGHLTPKKSRNGYMLALTPAGEERCRDIYELWLDQRGRDAFGDPLDHGDAAGGLGDPHDTDLQIPEADVQADKPLAAAVPLRKPGPEPVERIPPERAEELKTALVHLNLREIRAHLEAAGVRGSRGPADRQGVLALVDDLTPDQATKLAPRLAFGQPTQPGDAAA